MNKRDCLTSRIEDNNLELACASRTELIPRFARAKNIKGKWKYLLQASDGNVQNYQVGQPSLTFVISRVYSHESRGKIGLDMMIDDCLITR